MTDERIKEEFVLFMARSVPLRDIDFSRTLVGSVGDFDNIMLQSHAVGFIGGFRAAERLAKIEALEKVVNNAVPGFTMAYIENQIAELKEEGE